MDPTHKSPFQRDIAESKKPAGSKLVAFIHSHSAWQADTDNDFSNHNFIKLGKLDSDYIDENKDLTFYLAAPNGALRVYRSGASSKGSRVMATGFYHDSQVYGPNAKNQDYKTVKEVYNEELIIGDFYGNEQ